MTDQDLVAMLREIALDEKTSWDGWSAQDVATVESAADAIERLTAEVEALRKDAERYRWLRDTPWPAELQTVIQLHSNAIWDRAIDAARSA